MEGGVFGVKKYKNIGDVILNTTTIKDNWKVLSHSEVKANLSLNWVLTIFKGMCVIQYQVMMTKQNLHEFRKKWSNNV